MCVRVCVFGKGEGGRLLYIINTWNRHPPCALRRGLRRLRPPVVVSGRGLVHAPVEGHFPREGVEEAEALVVAAEGEVGPLGAEGCFFGGKGGEREGGRDEKTKDYNII